MSKVQAGRGGVRALGVPVAQPPGVRHRVPSDGHWCKSAELLVFL